MTWKLEDNYGCEVEIWMINEYEGRIELQYNATISSAKIGMYKPIWIATQLNKLQLLSLISELQKIALELK